MVDTKEIKKTEMVDTKEINKRKIVDTKEIIRNIKGWDGRYQRNQ